MIRAPRRVVTAIAAVATPFALVACSSGGSDDSSDESLVVYSGRDEELVAPLIEQFEDSSGIDVEVRYADTPAMAAQLLEEGEGTDADVFLSQDAGALGALAAEGMFIELPADVTDAVPEKYTSKDGTWVALTGRARVIAYDSERLSEDDVPADVSALTSEEWKGRFGIVPDNASFQAFVTAMRVTEGEDAAREWLEGIEANDPQIFSKNGELLEAVNSGAVEVGLINHYYWASSETDLDEMRAQLKFGEPGTVSALVNVTGAGILTGAADSDAAQEFVEFLVSDEAQEYFLTETAEYPLVEGMDAPPGVPELNDLGGPDIDLAELASLEETVDLITSVGLL